LSKKKKEKELSGNSEKKRKEKIVGCRDNNKKEKIKLKFDFFIL
jgi:hypothetical protein